MDAKTNDSAASLPQGLSQVKHIIAVGSGKGGVGKSTVAVNLAYALQTQGHRVGLMDADIYGPSQPNLLGAAGTKAQTQEDAILPTKKHNIDFVSIGLMVDGDGPVVWRAPMALKVIAQFISNVSWGELDYLLVDLPPGTGDVQLTLAQQASLSGAIIVTTPQQVALGIAKKGLAMFQQVNVPIVGIVENMSGFTCGECGHETAVFKGGGGQDMAGDLKVPFLGRIPLDPAVMLAGDDGVPIVKQHPDSSTSKAYLDLAKALTQKIGSLQVEKGSEPRKVEAGPKGELLVFWPDDHESVYTPYHLRLRCTCAACIDEDTGKKILDDKKVPLDIRLKSVYPVGRYGMGAEFTDGHNTGIYTFKHLRIICECAQCAPPSDSFTV